MLKAYSCVNFFLGKICFKDTCSASVNPDFYKMCKPSSRIMLLFLKKLLNEGAILNGITVCDEFFYSVIGENSHYGTPKNLNAPNCVPGGSSSGSAAALTTKKYDFSIGSDTGGSVRVPASFCGLLGIRPTHGRIVSDGVYPMAPSFDTVGWFANDIEIFRKVSSVLLNNKHASNISFNRYVVAEDLLELAENDIQRQFNTYLKKIFPNLKQIKLSKFEKSDIANNFRILQGGEINQYVIPWIKDNKPQISSEINNRIEMASKISINEINDAKAFRETLIKEVNNSIPEGDIALFPTAPFSAPICGQTDEALGSDRKKIMEMTSIAGMTSRPQISIPKFKGKTGPVGISMLGWINSDEILLKKLTEI